MKKIEELINNINVIEIQGSIDKKIELISFDSRSIIPGTLFIAVKGTNTDGHNYINQVIKNGAVAVVCENIPGEKINNITYIKVKDSSLALGYVASNFYGNPSGKLKLVGITGTNGKTTIATLLYNLFCNAGYKTGLISTVRCKINENEVKATHTTPDAIQLNYLLSRMVDENCTHCFMEVSSHSVVQKRIAGLIFAGGVFTNITHDHLDYHKTFDEYIKAKKTFFDNLDKEAFAISNIDDKNGNVILQNTKAVKKTYSLQKMADFKAKVIQNEFSGLQLNIDGNEVWCKLVGSFNAYNFLAIYSTAILLGLDKNKVLTSLSNLDSVEGRFEIIRPQSTEYSPLSSVIAIVDYAHTPDALSNVINTINQIRHQSAELTTDSRKLITVLGCGGDRDKAKRPIMAKIATEGSDKVIITSDNPRSEDPEEIIADMLKGISKIENGELKMENSNVLSIVNRKEAIKTACLLAKPGDIILVAGKGHENYQEIKGVKYPFDDKKILKEIFKIRNKTQDASLET